MKLLVTVCLLKKDELAITYDSHAYLRSHITEHDERSLMLATFVVRICSTKRNNVYPLEFSLTMYIHVSSIAYIMCGRCHSHDMEMLVHMCILSFAELSQSESNG